MLLTPKMKLLVWYNLNHHYYYTTYKNIRSPHTEGEINKFNHLLIQIIELSPPKTTINQRMADNLERLADRVRYGKQKKTTQIIKEKYPWWLKK